MEFANDENETHAAITLFLFLSLVDDDPPIQTESQTKTSSVHLPSPLLIPSFSVVFFSLQSLSLLVYILILHSSRTKRRTEEHGVKGTLTVFPEANDVHSVETVFFVAPSVVQVQEEVLSIIMLGLLKPSERIHALPKEDNKQPHYLNTNRGLLNLASQEGGLLNLASQEGGF